MTDYMPFDMKPNFKATEDDISAALLMDHLKKTKSRLARQVLKRGVMDVLGDMQLLVGPPEQQYITNVALMMFCDHLDQFFPYTQVEITKFPEGSIRNPNNFIEVPVIKGSVPEMINRTMQKLQDMVILEKVTKVNYQMEAIRRFSYPYQALEEAVVNAFYHRDYMSYQSIIIEIEPELIRIISYPGIDRSIPMRDIEAGERFSTRYYRNKRLGEFLKELDLSEGKCTGIPTIQEELRNNGSPAARFYTDDDRRAVTVEIPIHPDFLGMNDSMTVSEEKKTASSAKMTASDEKPAYSDGNLPNDGENSCVSDSNATSENGESIVSPEKVSFEDEESIVSPEKVSFENGESIVSPGKVSFEEILKRAEFTERTRENISLLRRAITEDIFSRADVVKLLRLSKPGAGKLMKKMKENMLIVPVSGHGKGKYRFITEEDEAE